MTRTRGAALAVAVVVTGVWSPGPALAQAKPRYLNPATMPPARGYSQLVEIPADQRLVFVSGQVALDRQGRLVGDQNFAAQAEQVFANLEAALREAGGTLADVVKLTYYLTDVANLDTLRAVRDRHLRPGPAPASTLVEVSHLFRGDLLLEIEAVAAVRR
jgi:enamine deaminase RidA (YjgF/YER057c/UK114 family)